MSADGLGIRLVGDGEAVPCVDGVDRPYLSLDAAASTPALPAVAERVNDALRSYSSVHRGAGWRSQQSTLAYEAARAAAIEFAGRRDRGDVAIFCRNTTEAINHLAYRLRLDRDDVVVTTVVEHHANLLPWSRVARCRYVDCGRDGTFEVSDVVSALDESPRPRLLAVTGASNVTGWLPPLDEIVAAAQVRGVPVLVDAAQLAPHRPLPAGPDFLAWSGHKMYAPFGTGVLVGPRATFATGDPFLAGGGAVDLVDLDEVVWTDPPEREEAGSPNVLGAVALHAAIDELTTLGWPAIRAHDDALAAMLHDGLRRIDGVQVLGPANGGGLPVATFVVDAMPHALVAARLSAEHAIGVRHGCFCAHPYLMRLLDLSDREVGAYRDAVLRGDRTAIPGAVRASTGVSATGADVERFLAALRQIIGNDPPVAYDQDPHTGDYWPGGGETPWADAARRLGASCARG